MKTLEQRRAEYEKASAEIAKLGDADLAKLIKESQQVHEGIGGTAVKLELGGVPVFAKQISLSDLEKDNPHSTKNLFNIPTFYQYGVGSAGFGAWRELAAHQQSTKWALDGECESFPLMYGYAIIPKEKTPPRDAAKMEEIVKYWGGSKEIGERLKAIDDAQYSVVFFLETIPRTLDDYIHPQASKGETWEVDMPMIERQLKDVTAFMESKGMIHFDAHGRNVLTDGERVYVADFGLATSLDFELSDAERKFFEENRGYDRALAFSCLGWHPRDEAGCQMPILPQVQECSNRYSELTNTVGTFFNALRKDETKEQVKYPMREIDAIFKKIESRDGQEAEEKFADKVVRRERSGSFVERVLAREADARTKGDREEDEGKF